MYPILKAVAPVPLKRSITLWKMLALTMPFFGLQWFWTIFTIYTAPYLTSSLHFSPIQVTTALSSGPVTGLIMFPVFGILSDRTSRRLPLILGGGFSTAGGLIALTGLQILMGLLTVDHDTIRFGLIVQCFAIFLLYFSCVGAQALQLGLRCQAIDLCPPQQQADINLWVTRWQSGASLCALLVGYSSPGFSVVSGGCSVALISTVLFFWLTQRGSGREGGKPVGTKSLRLLSTPKTIFGAWRSLPQLTKQVCVTQLFSQFSWFPVMHYLSLYLAESYTFTFSTSSKSSIEGAQASIRVILISQSAVLTVQTIAGHIWQSGGRRTGPDNLGHGHLISDDSMIALRKCWGISLICLALCIPSTAVFRNNVHIASLWTCTIQILGFFCNWIPNSIIAYEAASISDSNDESMSGGGEERPEAIMTATTLSIHNTAITVAQILSTIVSGVISWSFQTLAWKHFTWLLFQPGCITALTAAWFAINGHSTVSQGNGYGGSRA